MLTRWRVALLLLLPSALCLLPSSANAQQIRSAETITVERVLIDARITEASGDPILNLGPADFKVRIDGKPAKVESVEWIPETAGARELAALDRETAKTSLETPPPAGRLLVFFFQTDFARVAARVAGQMKINAYADEFLESLDPEDRVAVVSYDSHLKFRLDFTSDHEQISKAMRASLLTDDPPRPPIVPMPSLARALDEKSLRATATPEQALFLLGNALKPIPGPKSLILFGWGLGRLAGDHIYMGRTYAYAQHALESSRTSVFSIDITQADWHSLSGGLAKAAADTGGFYAETFNFPKIAMDRLQRTLEGHYEIEVRKPDTNVAGVHLIDVDVVGHRGAYVMARRTFADK
jgi:VWFA-related protein